MTFWRFFRKMAKLSFFPSFHYIRYGVTFKIDFLKNETSNQKSGPREVAKVCLLRPHILWVDKQSFKKIRSKGIFVFRIFGSFFQFLCKMTISLKIPKVKTSFERIFFKLFFIDPKYMGTK